LIAPSIITSPVLNAIRHQRTKHRSSDANSVSGRGYLNFEVVFDPSFPMIEVLLGKWLTAGQEASALPEPTNCGML
jgi:hypothetical protein